MVAKNTVTEKIFQSPSKYIQGPSAIKYAAKYLSGLGRNPLLIADKLVYGIAGKELTDALEQNGFKVHYNEFRGEASAVEVQRLSAFGQEKSVDFVISMGGGKTTDTSKATADFLKLPVAVLPTTASTDAPCSAVSVLYTESGEFDRYLFFDKNPNIVLVDTTVSVKAPPRFLASGVGDALATNVEARVCGNALNFGHGLPTSVASAIGQKCEDILFRYAKLAYEANKAQAITPAFEAVVEANTLLSGLGFESGGLAAAHAIQDGMTCIEELHKLMHGEKVAFGIVAQLILDNQPTSEIDRYIELMLSVDLPVTFELLGIPNVTDAQLRQVATNACAPEETIWNMDRVINVDIVFYALKGADAAGRSYIQRTGWKKQ